MALIEREIAAGNEGRRLARPVDIARLGSGIGLLLRIVGVVPVVRIGRGRRKAARLFTQPKPTAFHCLYQS